MRRINVSLIGGEHQFLHILPVAAWLARQPSAELRLFARDAVQAATARAMMLALGASNFALTILGDAPFARMWRTLAGAKAAKIGEVLAWHRTLRDCDVLLVAERTSAVLTRLPGRQPLYVRLTHGVGDRAKGFSRKARVFDHFIVAGEKYAERFVAEGIAPRERISTCGYIKIPAVRALRGGAEPQLFASDRPVVLYNPHFDEQLSSWPVAREVVETVLADGRWNLIFAPHVRLLIHAGTEEKARWEAYGEAENCHVDLGSKASTDMTYADAADIYLGDISSQLYEFLAEPRPCVFVNSHGVGWEHDESYRMWHLGEVIRSPRSELVPALERAAAAHEKYLPLQKEAIAETLGDMSGDPAERAGRIVLELIGRERSSGR